MHICFIRLQQWSVYFDLHNSTFPQLDRDRDDSARAQDFQVRPPRKLYLVVTTDRAIRQGPQFTSRDCFDSRSAHFLCQREFSFALFILIQGVLKVIKYWYKTQILVHDILLFIFVSYFSLDYQKTSRTRRKMSTVTITTPASTLRLSPLRVEDLLQGAIMFIWVIGMLIS